MRTGHLVRARACAGVPFLLAVPAAAAAGQIDLPRSEILDAIPRQPAWASVYGVAFCWLWATSSLWAAHRRYLRLPHAAGTVLASQAMVILVVLAAVAATL